MMNVDSKYLLNKIKLLTDSEVEKLKFGLQYTINNFPQAVMIGGCSVVAYINSDDRLLTPDLDFLVDIEHVKNRLVVDNIRCEPLLDSSRTPIGITTNDFTDYLDLNTGNYLLNKIIVSDYNTITINDSTVRIIRPELLIILKLELSRNKDVEDALLLLQSGNVVKSDYIKYLTTLKESLSDYQSLISYADMII